MESFPLPPLPSGGIQTQKTPTHQFRPWKIPTDKILTWNIPIISLIVFLDSLFC